ncbi:MAG: DUF4321 domain-containing protein [Gemmatimonadaceae bacterium]
MPPRGSAKHRPGYHALVLSIGFIVGGAFTEIARRWLPAGAVKEFLTTGVTPSIGPLPIDLVIIKFSVGPVALDVSILGLVGVLVAYLIARSLF